MMGHREWGRIASGATFEDLAITLVRFEDPTAKLFGRGGADGGQDARSGDGLRVFQAKYHKDASATTALKDAEREFSKIASFREQNHPRYEQWKGVKQWRLVTNADFGPKDDQMWTEKLVPLFATLGLSADYWGRRYLDTLLDKHPVVDRAYFQNETRVVLGISEARERLQLDEPFLQRTGSSAFFGREVEREHVQRFLTSDALFLVIHGKGGIGKSRLLFEIGERLAAEGNWQVLWANIASMSTTANWFDAIVPEQQTLLLVDEPDDAQLLRVLAEQLGGQVGRTAKWKVTITVRSPKDPVLRFMFAPRMRSRVLEMQLQELTSGAAEQMCNHLLATGTLAQLTVDWRQQASRELTKRFSRHPIWLTLAVHLLEKHGDLDKLPLTAESLAAFYLDEVVQQQNQVSNAQLLSVLHWIALVGTVNREDTSTITLLSERSSINNDDAVRRLLANLVTRRALTERGARDRLLEITPGVMRDHLLLTWLAVDVGGTTSAMQPSSDALHLVAEILNAILSGTLSSVERAILRSLARTELLFRMTRRAVPLLDSLFAGLLSRLESTTVSQRLLILEVLVDVAALRPGDVANCCRTLRCSSVVPETVPGLLKSREVRQDDIVWELAWPLFHAAIGADSESDRLAVLRELSAVVEAEALIASQPSRMLRNDGKRAAELIERTLGGGPEFSADFESAAQVLGHRMLNEMALREPAPEQAAAIRALLVPSLAMERSQVWSEDYKLHIRSYVITSQHPGWATREAMLRQIKDLLASTSIPIGSRTLLWELVAKAHQSTNQARMRVNVGLKGTMSNLLREELIWAHSILAERTGELEELESARPLWEWHSRFEEEAALKLAADQLESLYLENGIAAEFEPLLSRSEWDQVPAREEEKAHMLASSESPKAIEAFLERAIRFLGHERELFKLFGVAWRLGSYAPRSTVAAEFIRSSLMLPVSPRARFAAHAAANWVASTRRSSSGDESYDLIVELMGNCGDEEGRMNLIAEVYGWPERRRFVGQPTLAECQYLRTLSPLFLQSGHGPKFMAVIGSTIPVEWPTLRPLIEQTLDSIPGPQITAAVSSLIDRVHWALREGDLQECPPDFNRWLLDQVLRVPDLGELNSMVEWELNEVLKKIGRVSASWLPYALERRIAMERESRAEAVRAVGYHDRWSNFVREISEADVGEQKIERSVEALVDMSLQPGIVGHYIPAMLHDVDPQGRVVPRVAASRFAGATDLELAYSIARIGGAYPLDGPAWRTIAVPVVTRANHSAQIDERYTLYGCLIDHGIRSWFASIGEVPQLFVTAVEDARQKLLAESDEELRHFWEWHLAVAERELQERSDSAKEERGE